MANSSSSGEPSAAITQCTEMGCYELADAQEWIVVLHTTCVSVIIVASLLGNGIVLLLVSKYKQLRCRSALITLSIVGADLMITATLHLPSLSSATAMRWLFSGAGCVAFSAMSFEFIATRWLVLAVLGINRFATVKWPFTYEKYSKCVLTSLISAAWVLPAVLSAPAVGGFADPNLSPSILSCAIDCGKEGVYRFYFTVILSGAFGLGSVLSILLYLWLYHKARHLRLSAVTLGVQSVQMVNGMFISQPIAQLEKSFREGRAIFTFAIMIFSVLVTGLPTYISHILRVADTDVWCSIPIPVHLIMSNVFLLSTALDPLFIMRDQDFQQCLKQLFCCCNSDTSADSMAGENANTPSSDNCNQTSSEPSTLLSSSNPGV